MLHRPRSLRPVPHALVLIGLAGAAACGDDSGIAPPDDAGVDAGRRDAGRPDAGRPVDAGPPDAGPPDGGPETFGLPWCTGTDARVSLVTFSGAVEVGLDEDSPRTLLTGEGIGDRRSTAVVRYLSDREIGWIAEVDSRSDVVGEKALVDATGSVFVMYRVTVSGTTEVVFKNADGTQGARYTRPGSGMPPFFPEPGGSFATNNQQCFVVRYDVDGAVVWSNQLGFVNGDIAERGCEPRGLALVGEQLVATAYLKASPPGGNGATNISLGGLTGSADRGAVHVVARFDAATGSTERSAVYWVSRTDGPFGSSAPDRRGGTSNVTIAGTVLPGSPVTTSFQVNRFDQMPDALPEDAPNVSYLTRYDRVTQTQTWVRAIVGGETGIGQQLVSGDGSSVLVGYTDDLVDGETVFGGGEGGDVTLSPSLGVWVVRYDGDGAVLWTQSFGWATDPTNTLFRAGMTGQGDLGARGRTVSSVRDERIIVAGLARGQAMDVTFGTGKDAEVVSLGRDEAYLAFLDRESGEVVGDVSRHSVPYVPLEAGGDELRFEAVAEPGEALFLDGSTISLTIPGGVRTVSLFRAGTDGVPFCAFPTARAVDVDVTSFVD